MTIKELYNKIVTCQPVEKTTLLELKKPNSTTEKHIQNNLFFCDHNSLYYYELPQPTEASISIIRNTILNMTNNEEEYNFILDLSRAKRPNAETRKLLQQFLPKEFKIKNFYVYTEGNLILQLAAKFVIPTIIKNHEITFVNSREEALKLSQQP